VAEKFIDFFSKISWAMVGGIAALIIGFFTFTYDTSMLIQNEESIKVSQDSIKTLEGKIEEAKRFEKEYVAKRAQYRALVNELIAVQGVLPKQFILPDIIDDILREARRLELDITTMTPDPKEDPKEFYSSLGFSLDVRGTYLQFLIFMERLTTMKRLFSVVGANINREGEAFAKYGGRQGLFIRTKLEGGTSIYPVLRANFRVLTYRFRAESVTVNPPPAGKAPDAKKGGS
jgi:Tfp pilus assembly protein PilO